MPIKQEIFSKGFSSFRTVKDTAEGFTKPVLQEYVVIFCKLQKKSSFSEGKAALREVLRLPQFIVLYLLLEFL